MSHAAPGPPFTESTSWQVDRIGFRRGSSTESHDPGGAVVGAVTVSTVHPSPAAGSVLIMALASDRRTRRRRADWHRGMISEISEDRTVGRSLPGCPGPGRPQPLPGQGGPARPGTSDSRRDFGPDDVN
eukprot:767956-Hanusia_phi.AAC.7